jgi:hypothetical protein
MLVPAKKQTSESFLQIGYGFISYIGKLQSRAVLGNIHEEKRGFIQFKSLLLS